MDFKQFASKEINNGIQFKNFFPNGFGVSIVRHDFSYCDDTTWELAVLKGNADKWELTYTTPITSNVLEFLTDEEVNEICTKVSEL
jgi:hypothetical protein